MSNDFQRRHMIFNKQSIYYSNNVSIELRMQSQP